jgi:MYXO-CTERM domain-containing protein
MLWGDVSSDNCVTDLIVNGQSTGFNMRGLFPTAACTKTHYSFQLGGSGVMFTAADGSVFTTHVNFLAGLNTIQFKVSNFVCGVGCTQNPTGIVVRIDGNVDSPGDPEPTPEPATAGLAGLALGAAVLVQRRRHA